MENLKIALSCSLAEEDRRELIQTITESFVIMNKSWDMHETVRNQKWNRNGSKIDSVAL